MICLHTAVYTLQPAYLQKPLAYLLTAQAATVLCLIVKICIVIPLQVAGKDVYTSTMARSTVTTDPKRLGTEKTSKNDDEQYVCGGYADLVRSVLE
jgi:hypothetical protein